MFGRGDALFQLAEFSGQRGLIADRRRHAAEQGGNFGTGLHIPEDVVDEEQDVLVLHVAEVFRHGQPGESGAHSRTGGFVHLPEYERRIVDNP